jgi:hypothetical protein
LPALTLKETQDILSKILERVKIISVRYARASQQIQQQVAQQGQQMSELEVNKHFVLPHFETGFQEAEEEVLGVRKSRRDCHSSSFAQLACMSRNCCIQYPLMCMFSNFQEFDCDSDELEEAGRYYAEKEKDEMVIELLTKLKKLHATFGGVSFTLHFQLQNFRFLK